MLFRTAIRNIQVRYFIDHDPDHRRTTFLSGMGRSGTTWLAELINFKNDYRFLFEPFDPGRVALAVNFTDRTYLRPSDDRRAFLAPARAIVTGQVREQFVDQHNRRIVADRRLVKEVRANLFLRWLFHHFSGMPLVLIVRHPLAVAASRLATDEDVDVGSELLGQKDLVADYLAPYAHVLRSCVTPFERHVATWCVEYGVPLSQFHQGEICVVFYERLVTEPLPALRDVFAYLGRPFDKRISRSVQRPSVTTLSPPGLTEKWERGAGRVTTAWKEKLTTAQVRRGLELLEAFGLGYLYDESPLPLVDRPVLGRPFGSGSASENIGLAAKGS